ncbi:MAG: lipid-A-disaccharide synthase [Bacteroidetes bacterium]|nr:lipid-A-disaccharide synthase [Bacteroidota bacterium]
MKYYFLTGEPSGDLHASNCIKEIMRLDNNADFAFTGGDLMEELTGKKAAIHIKQMAFMGFIRVLQNIFTIKQNFKIVKKDILNYKPDLLVLVDYPGFNLRMAKWAHENNIKVDFYVSPTVWAWKEGRVEIIKKYVNKLFVILPFEEAFYKEKHDHQVYFVGHPLIDAIEQKKPTLKTKVDFIKENGLNEKPIIAILPGSRAQEIEYMLGIMMEVTKNFSDHQFVVGGSTNLPASFYDSLKKYNIKVVFNQTYELMSYAEAGIIKSGTSTLESALFKLPEVVCYKSGALSIKIAKMLVDVKYISLPNLIMDKPVVKELIQNDLSVKGISDELKKLLHDIPYREKMINDYIELEKQLGGPGASKRLAVELVKDATTNN